MWSLHVLPVLCWFPLIAAVYSQNQKTTFELMLLSVSMTKGLAMAAYYPVKDRSKGIGLILIHICKIDNDYIYDDYILNRVSS